MAQQSHVPKFGDWDSENVPYTAFFENARKDRGVKMNPNDPEENPEAFMYLERKRVDSERKERLRSLDMNPNDPEQNPEAFLGLGRCVNQHSIGVDQKNASNQQQRRETHRSSNSGSTSEKSNSYSENSTMQPNHRRARSDQKRSSRESVGSVRTGNSHSDESVNMQPHRAASIPAFGDWDETDPKSGEGYTVIFNKVKEEKQIGAANLPASAAMQSSKMQTKQGNSSSILKVWCEKMSFTEKQEITCEIYLHLSIY